MAQAYTRLLRETKAGEQVHSQRGQPSGTLSPNGEYRSLTQWQSTGLACWRPGGPGLGPAGRKEYSLLREDKECCSHLLHPSPNKTFSRAGSHSSSVFHQAAGTWVRHGLPDTFPSRWLRLSWMSGPALTLELWNSIVLQREAQGTPGQQEGTRVSLRLSTVLPGLVGLTDSHYCVSADPDTAMLQESSAPLYCPHTHGPATWPRQPCTDCDPAWICLSS